MRVLIILSLLYLPVSADAQSSSEAEATAKRYANALARFDEPAMVDELHTDTHKFCQLMAVQIYNTTDNAAERSRLLELLGVENLDTYKELAPKEAAVRFFRFGFANVPKQLRDLSADARLTIVGSLVEGDAVHVLYRTEAQTKELPIRLNVPSVVSLKKDGDKFKVVSTTQFDAVKAKLLPADGK